MSRVSTYGNYQSALLNLLSAQTRGQDAQTRVSTQKNATDLTGFGRGSEVLTALKSSQSRIQGFIDTGEAVANRLTSQDLAFSRVAEGAVGARDALGDALASGRAEGVLLELQSQFQVVQSGLNLRHQGRYLFAGGNVNVPPVSVSTLADLAATPVANVFTNDQLVQKSQLDEGASLDTGFLADDVGGDLFRIFREIQDYHAVTPLTGPISEATRAFLSLKMGELNTAHEAVTNKAARNGSLQNQVESVLAGQQAQKVSLEELVSERTDADLAKAITDLELSQVAIQASAQVLNQLRQVSLLNFLN